MLLVINILKDVAKRKYSYEIFDLNNSVAPCEQTDRCKNITFLQLRLRAEIICKKNIAIFVILQVKSLSSPSSGLKLLPAKLRSAEFLPDQNTDLVGEK